MNKTIKVKVNRKILYNALNNIKPIISGRHTFPILSSILISAKENNTIEIFATDLEAGFKGVYPAEVLEAGNMTILHKELLSCVSKIKSDEVTIEVEDSNWAIISGDSFTMSIICNMDFDDFPLMPEEINCMQTIEIGSNKLKDLVTKMIVVKPCDDRSKVRPYVACVFFEIMKEGYLKLASTNGKIIVESKEKISIIGEVNAKKDLLIPKIGLEKLNKSFLKNVKKAIKGKNKGFGLLSSDKKITFGLENNFFIAQKQNETIVIRLLEDQFPPYKEIINREEHNIAIVDRKILLEAMIQLTPLQDSYYNAATINFEENILKMIFTNPNLGEIKKNVVIQYNGEPLEITFYPKQFVDFLNLMQSDIVSLDIRAKSACLITGVQDKDTIFGIMPFIEG